MKFGCQSIGLPYAFLGCRNIIETCHGVDFHRFFYLPTKASSDIRGLIRWFLKFLSLQKSFPTSTALKIHLISHTSDREYRCSEPGCPFQTKYKSYLTLHGRKHNGKAHVCEVCGYTTLKMSLLQCHKRTHTNEKIFVCSECQVSRQGTALSSSRNSCLSGFQRSVLFLIAERVRREVAIDASPEDATLGRETVRMLTMQVQL